MELNGEQIVRAPRQKVWDAINDPTVLSRCIPGCEEVTKVSDNEMQTKVAIKIGPVRARFAGKIFMSDVVADSGCVLTFEGSGGGAGFAKGKSRVTLTDEGTATRLAYTVEASVGGKLGQIGGRLIDSSAKKMADEFFAAFDSALTGGSLPTLADVITKTEPASSSPSGTRVTSTFENSNSPMGWGIRNELYRVFWFSLGVTFTLFLNQWFR